MDEFKFHIINKIKELSEIRYKAEKDIIEKIILGAQERHRCYFNNLYSLLL